RDPANPLRRSGHLSALHAFEYSAQAAAVHGGLHARSGGTTAPPGYPPALRGARLHVAHLEDTRSPLPISGRRLFGEASHTSKESRVSAGDTAIAEGRIKVIQRDLRPSG